MLKTLTPAIYVSPQIDVDTVAYAKTLGVTLIVNNRPEGESTDQTPGPEVEAAARVAGIDYVAVPIGRSEIGDWELDTLATALEAHKASKTLCYCRSGTRSTLLWALCRARAGDDLEQIAQQAAQAGYDVAPVREMMIRLAPSNA